MFMLRRLKVEVEKLMPLKVELQVKCPLSVEQKHWYKAILLRDISLLDSFENVLREKDGTAPPVIAKEKNPKKMDAVYSDEEEEDEIQVSAGKYKQVSRAI